MENSSGVMIKRDDQMDLPPGFRFHPTDEELITHYLSKKVLDSSFSAVAIGEVDMNKVEPWELPWRARNGEKEWYFFCIRDKKYPTGQRTNRATAVGYWKATGKDKEIFRGKTLVGMKKTLVFYKGRAPKGEKSNWVNHEYRLEGKFSLDHLLKPDKLPFQNDWVISRVFKKTSGGKKIHISGLMRMSSCGNEIVPSSLPPLMDPSVLKPAELESCHVHCFSNNNNNNNNSMVNATLKMSHEVLINNNSNNNNLIFGLSSNTINSLDSSGFQWGRFAASPNNQALVLGFQFPGPVSVQDSSALRTFLGQNVNMSMNMDMNHQQGLIRKDRDIVSVSQETAVSTENSSVVSNYDTGKRPFEGQEAPMEPQDLDCFWNY